MAVSQDNTRIIVTINKKLKEKLKLLAKEEQRSVSNLCSKIVSDYIKGKDKQDVLYLQQEVKIHR